MLKAVRFDEDTHKHLLEYIDWYTDKNGKKNESEAIRFLMQRGFEAIESEKPFTLVNAEEKIENVKESQTPVINVDDLKKELTNDILQSVISQQSKEVPIDIESLKKDLLNDILQKVNTQTLESINNLADKLANFQPMVIQQPIINSQQNAEVQQTVSKPKPIKKQVEIPADTNPLLANILANANR